MKMITAICIMLMLSARAFAPATNSLVIIQENPIMPYEKIWQAICWVESSNNSLAYHMEDNGSPSIGIAQVQNSRIIDFNKRFRQSFTLMDMYVPNKAKIVFMAYCSDFRPDDNESISRCWNGGNNGMGKKSTIKYYLQVKKQLNTK